MLRVHSTNLFLNALFNVVPACGPPSLAGLDNHGFSHRETVFLETPRLAATAFSDIQSNRVGGPFRHFYLSFLSISSRAIKLEPQ